MLCLVFVMALKICVNFDTSVYDDWSFSLLVVLFEHSFGLEQFLCFTFFVRIRRSNIAFCFFNFSLNLIHLGSFKSNTDIMSSVWDANKWKGAKIQCNPCAVFYEIIKINESHHLHNNDERHSIRLYDWSDSWINHPTCCARNAVEPITTASTKHRNLRQFSYLFSLCNDSFVIFTLYTQHGLLPSNGFCFKFSICLVEFVWASTILGFDCYLASISDRQRHTNSHIIPSPDKRCDMIPPYQ